jgi:hypothetical protein
MNLKNIRGHVFNLLVLRTNKSKQLCSSKPCINCIRYMKKITMKYKFTLKYIYYSTNEKTIIKTTLYELDNANDKHLSLGERRRRNMI